MITQLKWQHINYIKLTQNIQEMFVKHWPPARARWNTCLDLHLTQYVMKPKVLDQYLHLTQHRMKHKVLDQHLYLTQ